MSFRSATNLLVLGLALVQLGQTKVTVGYIANGWKSISPFIVKTNSKNLNATIVSCCDPLAQPRTSIPLIHPYHSMI